MAGVFLVLLLACTALAEEPERRQLSHESYVVNNASRIWTQLQPNLITSLLNKNDIVTSEHEANGQKVYMRVPTSSSKYSSQVSMSNAGGLTREEMQILVEMLTRGNRTQQYPTPPPDNNSASQCVDNYVLPQVKSIIQMLLAPYEIPPPSPGQNCYQWYNTIQAVTQQQANNRLVYANQMVQDMVNQVQQNCDHKRQ